MKPSHDRCHINDLEKCVSRLFITITITIVCWCILIRQIPPRILLFPTQYPTVCVRSCNTWFFPTLIPSLPILHQFPFMHALIYTSTWIVYTRVNRTVSSRTS